MPTAARHSMTTGICGSRSGGPVLLVAWKQLDAPIRTPVLIGRQRKPPGFAVGDEASEGFQCSPHGVDERAVRGPRGLGHAVESSKDEARSIHEQPFRQSRLILAAL